MSTIEIPRIEVPEDLQSYYPRDLAILDLHSKTTALARKLARQQVEAEERAAKEAAPGGNLHMNNDAFWARVDFYDQGLTSTRLPELTALAQHLERLKVARERAELERRREASAQAQREKELAEHSCAICGATNVDPLGFVATRTMGRLGFKSCGRCYAVALAELASRAEVERMSDGRTRRERVAVVIDKAGA